MSSATKRMLPAHHNLGYVDLHSSELGGARRHFRQALEWVASNRDTYLLPNCIVVLALRDGELDRAATLLAGAQAVFTMTGAVPDPDDRVEIDGCRRELETRLEADVYRPLSKKDVSSMSMRCLSSH